VSEPYLAEIRLVGFTYPPRGWAECNGQLLSIAQNQALFSLLGTTYGGDGRVTFALPDLRGRIPLHFGQGPGLSNYTQGQVGGEEAVTLNISQLPAHTHTPPAANNNPGPDNSPQGEFWAASDQSDNIYAATANAAMAPGAIGNTGGSQPHPNIQPSLVLMFIIALQGIYPSRN
jgi:microcystin-dependent protein